MVRSELRIGVTVPEEEARGEDGDEMRPNRLERLFLLPDDADEDEIFLRHVEALRETLLVVRFRTKHEMPNTSSTMAIPAIPSPA